MISPPTRITVDKTKTLMVVEFADGTSHEFAAEILRVLSPSAEVQGHSASERKLIGGKKDVTITAIEPVGNYAIRIDFADGHNTGIYSWQFLVELADNYDRRRQDYFDALEKAGLSR